MAILVAGIWIALFFTRKWSSWGAGALLLLAVISPSIANASAVGLVDQLENAGFWLSAYVLGGVFFICAGHLSMSMRGARAT